jgi:hypothetical protein
MSGYRRDPVIRIIPRNSPEEVYWFTDNLTDVGSHTRIMLHYELIQQMREDINRSLRPIIYGWRPEVTIDCVIWSMTDQLFLSRIEEALSDRDGYDVFLSIDGGVVYRRVILMEGADAKPISGKTVVGASFSLAMKCVDLISRRPAMMTDQGTGGELIEDGGFEQWDTAAQPRAWVTGSGVGTVAQELTIIRSGLSSAKVTRSDGATFFSFQQRNSATSIEPRPGHWYRVLAYARGSIDIPAGGSGPFRIQVFNVSRNESIGPDGKTIGGDLSITGVLAATWSGVELYFRVPSNWLPANEVYLRFVGYWAAGESLYYDDASVYGPVLRPGYATW